MLTSQQFFWVDWSRRNLKSLSTLLQLITDKEQFHPYLNIDELMCFIGPLRVCNSCNCVDKSAIFCVIWSRRNLKSLLTLLHLLTHKEQFHRYFDNDELMYFIESLRICNSCNCVDKSAIFCVIWSRRNLKSLLTLLHFATDKEQFHRYFDIDELICFIEFLQLCWQVSRFSVWFDHEET